MEDLCMNSDQAKQFWKKSFTLSGRVYYPNLLKPTTNKNGRSTFNTMFAWPYDSNKAVMAELNQFLMTAKQTFHPSVPMQFFINPLKKFDTYQRQDGKPNAEYLKNHFWLNAQSGAEIPVPVVDQMRQPIISEAEIYSGRNAVINVSFYNIDKEKKGIGVNVNAVMLMEGGERVGAGGSVNIDQIFGGFSQDMALPTQGSQDVPPPVPGTSAANPFGNTNGGGFV
jgi:hypothetical protein